MEDDDEPMQPYSVQREEQYPDVYDTTDSDSLVGDGSERRCACVKDPLLRKNWRPVVVASTLTVIGILLIIIGIAFEVARFDAVRGFIFGILGGICIIPGGYILFFSYRALQRDPEYNFDRLPTFF